MGCQYVPADNKIIVTGYTSDVPCTFTTLHTEDKAGTLDLMPATLPAMNMVLTTQIKPSDELALKIDFILASSGAGAGDTIDITGTDKDGNAQSETLTTTADGTFTTTKWFKTITDIDCNGFNSGTLTVRQNQWGVVWKPSDREFRIVETNIYLGDINNHAYFGDKNKQIIIYNMPSNKCLFDGIANKGHLYFGEYDNETLKTTKNGCTFCFDGSVPYPAGDFCNNPVDLYLYGTLIQRIKTNSDARLKVGGTNGRIWQTHFNNGFYITNIAGNLDMYDITYSNTGTTTFFFSTSGNVEKITSYNVNYAIALFRESSITRGLYARNVNKIAWFVMPTGHHYFIDFDVDWNKGFAYWGSYSWKMYRQYTFNLKVIDKNGTGIGNATVILKDKDGNIANQKGFETLTSNISNTKGEITEQIISYGYYWQSTGDTLQCFSPHTLTISHQNYTTYEFKFNLSNKIDWTIGLSNLTLDDSFNGIFYFNHSETNFSYNTSHNYHWNDTNNTFWVNSNHINASCNGTIINEIIPFFIIGMVFSGCLYTSIYMTRKEKQKISGKKSKKLSFKKRKSSTYS